MAVGAWAAYKIRSDKRDKTTEEKLISLSRCFFLVVFFFFFFWSVGRNGWEFWSGSRRGR